MRAKLHFVQESWVVRNSTYKHKICIHIQNINTVYIVDTINIYRYLLYIL